MAETQGSQLTLEFDPNFDVIEVSKLSRPEDNLEISTYTTSVGDCVHVEEYTNHGKTSVTWPTELGPVAAFNQLRQLVILSGSAPQVTIWRNDDVDAPADVRLDALDASFDAMKESIAVVRLEDASNDQAFVWQTTLGDSQKFEFSVIGTLADTQLVGDVLRGTASDSVLPFQGQLLASIGYQLHQTAKQL